MKTLTLKIFLTCSLLGAFATCLAGCSGRGFTAVANAVSGATAHSKSAEHQSTECPRLNGTYCHEEIEHLNTGGKGREGTSAQESCITQKLVTSEDGKLSLDEGHGPAQLVDGSIVELGEEFGYDTATKASVSRYCRGGVLYTEYSQNSTVTSSTETKLSEDGQTLTVTATGASTHAPLQGTKIYQKKSE